MGFDLFHWSVQHFQSFLMVLMRVAFILFMMPILNSRNVSAVLKAGLALMVSLILLPVVRVNMASFPSEPLEFAFLMVYEGLIGFFLGLSLRILFAGILLAGEFVGFQMGLAMAQIVDPQSGTDATLIAQFYNFIAILIFLSIDGHHWFFRVLVQSFQVLPPGGIGFNEGLYRHFVSASGNMFVMGIKIAAPVTAILILTQVALGIVAKTVPQFNILMSSFPLTIGLGMIFLGLSFDLLFPYLRGLFEDAGRGLGSTVLPLLVR